jgi:hypothetical protein
MVSALLIVKSSWLPATLRLRKLDPTGTLTISKKMRCPPTRLLTRPPMTRTLGVTAIESGMNVVDVSERLSQSGTSTRL